MFGSFAHIIPAPPEPPESPKDVPPPTPINFPRCCPQKRDHHRPGSPSLSSDLKKSLVAHLQTIVRPADVNIAHLEALGVNVTPNASLADIIPDSAFIPPFSSWGRLSLDEAHSANESTRRPLNTGALSPGCVVYLDRKRELSIPNETAFRAVRRIPPPRGQSQARLGNSFEFFRYLELFATFWDDTSKVKTDENKCELAAPEPPKPDEAGEPAADSPPRSYFFRSGSGNQMPGEYRQNLVTAFLKLVAYDFGCNVAPARIEPRLYTTSPAALRAANSEHSPPQLHSYFSSGCTFIFRTPRTREAARAGLVEGPVAAVSARHTTAFPPPRPTPPAPTIPSGAEPAVPGESSSDRESVIDLARELVAALLTAQHRAREGKTEKRIGQDAWWTTKPRWGGGPGGPIGREVETQSGADETVGDKDEPARCTSQAASGSRADLQAGLRRPSRMGCELSPSAKGPKRLKKSGNLSMYDNYRKVRPPGPAWDAKSRYAAIGRRRGTDFDDVFVISCLFHHVSVLRVRVPDRLLEVLEGASEEEQAGGEAGGSMGPRSWGSLEVWRSPWFDLFVTQDRIAAMELVWAMMAYLMRKEE